MAETVLQAAFSVSDQEEVLILGDNSELMDFFANEASREGAEALECYLPMVQRPYKRLTSRLKSLVCSLGVVITPIQRLRKEGAFRREIIKTVLSKGSRARLGHMPGITLDTIRNCVLKSNLNEIVSMANNLIPILAKSRSIVISTDKGTNIRLPIGNWIRVDGDIGRITEPQTWDNIPSGEVFVTFNGEKANGDLVIDGGYPGKALEDGEEISLKIEKGAITEISGGASEHLRPHLERADKEADTQQKGNIYNLAEFGVGLNRSARKNSNIIEFEKQLGTVHFGFGDNSFIGGNNKAKEHIDMVVENPSIRIDDIDIMVDGKFLFENAGDLQQDSLDAYPILRCPADSVIRPSSEAGICILQDEKCFRRWLSSKGRIFEIQVGNTETSKIVALAAKMIKQKNVLTIADLTRKLRIPNKDGQRLISMMHRYGLIEITC